MQKPLSTAFILFHIHAHANRNHLQWNQMYRKVILAARDKMYKESSRERERERERNTSLFIFAIINYVFISYAFIRVFMVKLVRLIGKNMFSFYLYLVSCLFIAFIVILGFIGSHKSATLLHLYIFEDFFIDNL